MSGPRPDIERPYRTDEEWSRAVSARRTGQVAAFLAPHLRRGMRLLDCGCGHGSITGDLAQAVAPGEAIGIAAERTPRRTGVRAGNTNDVRRRSCPQGPVLAT